MEAAKHTDLAGWDARLPEDPAWAHRHPVVLLRGAELERVQARIAVEGPPRAAWARLVRLCERYVTPGDSQYRDPEKAFQDYLALDAQTHEGRAQMEVTLRRWTSPVELLAFAHAVSGREEFGRAAVQLALAGARRVPPDKMQPGFFLTRSFLTRACTLALDWCYAQLSTDERQELRQALGQQVHALYWGTLNGVWGQSSLGRIWNWNAGAAAAWGLAALVLDGETDFPTRPWLFQATRNLEDYFDFGVDPAGGVIEGPVYLSYGAGIAPFFVEALRGATGEDLYAATHLRRLLDWMPWEILPGGGRVNNLMDSDHLVKNADILSYLRSRDAGKWADGVWRELFGKADPASINNESLPALVLWAPTAAELARARYPAVEALSALAPGRGLAVSRSSWGDDAVMFSIHAQAYTEFKHDQADKGQFTLYAYGADLVVDSGYGNDANRERSSSAFAHNLVLVDGEPQLQGGAHARTDGWIRTCLSTAAADLVRVDQRDAYEFFYASNFQDATYRKVRVRDFVRAERTSLFVRGDFPYVVLFDDIQRDEVARTYSWLLHTAAGNRVVPDNRVVRIEATKAYMELQVLHPEAISVNSDEFQTTRGGVHPRIRVDATGVRPRFLMLLMPFPAQAGSRPPPRVERLQSQSGAPVARIVQADGRVDWFAAGPAVAPDGSAVDAAFCWMRFAADGRREQMSASRLQMLNGAAGVVLEAAEPVDIAWTGEVIEVGPGHSERLRVVGDAARMRVVESPPPVLPLGLPIRAKR